MERQIDRMEPVFGGFLRVWRFGGKLAVPFVCAGAGAQGWCDITLHSSISSIKVIEMGYKILRELALSGVWQMERGVAGGSIWAGEW